MTEDTSSRVRIAVASLPLRTITVIACMLAMLYTVTPSPAFATNAASVGADFYYTFNTPGTLLESGSMDESTSPYFYVNSGGKLVIENGVGATVEKELDEFDLFRTLYAVSNALDTDEGYYPQNIFRLLTRSRWQDATLQMKFQITAQNLSDSPNRQGHNGVLLMSRYQDGDNLYYAGIRNDGQAIIKKKIHGVYHTLASVQIFGTPGKYDRDTLPSLLPRDQWMGMKMQVYNLSNGAVRIRLLIDRENDGSFVSILAADDTDIGGPAFRDNGYAGIRTDFMDVEFDNFRLTNM